MSIQIIEIRQFQGPATVELSGVGVPEIVEVRQGPAGLNGPNNVTSATTSDATCVLTLEALSVGPNSTVTGSAAAAIGESSATASYAFAVGYQNTASGGASFASGTGSTASGFASFTLGSSCLASGTSSIAIGVRAKAIHDGASVESDSQDADVESTTTDEKTFRFQNGYRFLGGAVTIDGTLNASHIHGNVAGSVYAHVRAGENLAKGDPVYISGSHGTGANLIAIVSKADASNASKMPAVGVMDAAVSNNANGHMVITGTISDIDTNAYAVNSVLYVASGGGWTSTPPAANSQPVAIVERSNTNNGAVIVKVNGLASSGGNGASDANKLARFSSAGTLPIANIGDLGTNVATFLATPTSANLAAAVTGETGTGALVFANSPTFSGTPLIGTKIILSENGFQRAFLSSDYTIATTNTGNKIPSFSISVESGKTYKLEIMLKVTGVAGSTHNSTLVGSFNLTAANSSMMYRRAGFETENFVLASTPFSGFGLFSSTGTSSQICFLDGIIKPTSSGVLEVVLYSSSATNSVTMLKGAYMEATLLD